MRLVFYELLPGRVRLDAITDAGEPVTLEVSLPATLWAVAAVETLDRWVLDTRPIRLLLRATRRGIRLELSDGQARITLDLLSPVPRWHRPRSPSPPLASTARRRNTPELAHGIAPEQTRRISP